MTVSTLYKRKNETVCRKKRDWEDAERKEGPGEPVQVFIES